MNWWIINHLLDSLASNRNHTYFMRAINFVSGNATSSNHRLNKGWQHSPLWRGITDLSVYYCLVARVTKSKADGVMDHFYCNAKDYCNKHYLAHMNPPQELTLLICSVIQSKIDFMEYI